MIPTCIVYHCARTLGVHDRTDLQRSPIVALAKIAMYPQTEPPSVGTAEFRVSRPFAEQYRAIRHASNQIKDLVTNC